MTRLLRETLEIVDTNRERHQPHVFTYQGKPLTTHVACALKRIVTRADVMPCTLHTLRHTFASHLAMRGAPLMHIRELLGHRDYKMTLVYAHLSSGSHKDAVQLLPYANAPTLADGRPEDGAYVV